MFLYFRQNARRGYEVSIENASVTSGIFQWPVLLVALASYLTLTSLHRSDAGHPTQLSCGRYIRFETLAEPTADATYHHQVRHTVLPAANQFTLTVVPYSIGGCLSTTWCAVAQVTFYC